MHALRPLLAPASTLFILFLPLVSKYVPSPGGFLKGLPTWSATTELGTNNWWLCLRLRILRVPLARGSLVSKVVVQLYSRSSRTAHCMQIEQTTLRLSLYRATHKKHTDYSLATGICPIAGYSAGPARSCAHAASNACSTSAGSGAESAREISAIFSLT